MEKNEDGLTPGQQVDFATLQRIERSRQPDAQAELRAQGFKIVDARFKPADAVEPEQSAPVDPHRRGRKPRN